MFIDGLHEKDIYMEKYPFRLVENSHNDFQYPPHWHNAVEIMYLSKGDFPIKVNNMEMNLTERDILIISAGDIHSFPESKCRGVRFFIQFNPIELEGIGINAIKPFSAYTVLISKDKSPEFHKSMENQLLMLIDEYAGKSHGYEFSLNARIFDIMAIWSRSCFSNMSGERSLITSRKISGLDKINKAFEFIELHYRNEITLKEIAKFSGFSEYHFSRTFKVTLEKNFHDYLKEFRIRKSEKLLSASNYSVTEAAYMSGFNSLATFNRAFKDIKGCTPTEYRKLFVVPAP